MDADHEAARQAGHVLLDAASVIEEGTEWAASADLAIQRLAEVGAIGADVTETDHEVNVTIQASPLMAVTVGLLNSLLAGWADVRGVDRDQGIIEMREVVDRNFRVE